MQNRGLEGNVAVLHEQAVVGHRSTLLSLLVDKGIRGLLIRAPAATTRALRQMRLKAIQPTSRPISSPAKSKVFRKPQDNGARGARLRSMNLFALRDFAKAKNPTAALPPSVLLLETPKCIAVFDAYPKAIYHFLVLPKIPFVVSETKQLNEAELDNLSVLLQHPDHEQVLAALKEAAAEVVDMVRDEMVKTYGFEWPINSGFHSIPSMRHLHLHVISDDLVSSSLKTKKHYNSFNPNLGFFVPLDEADDKLVIVKRDKEALLKSALVCLHCDKEFGNMPQLKTHLADEFKHHQTRQTKQ